MENTRSDRYLISSKQNTQSIILRSFKFLLTIHSFHLVDLSMRLFTGNIWSDSEKAADSLCQDFVRGERQLQCEPTCCRREPVMKNAFHQTSLVTRQFCPDISCDFVHRQITKIQEFSELLHDFFPITYYAWLYTFPEKSYDPQILSRKVLQLYSGHPYICFYSQGDLSKNMLRKFWLNGERGKVLLSQNWFSSKVFPQLQQFTQFTANCLSCPNIWLQLQ